MPLDENEFLLEAIARKLVTAVDEMADLEAEAVKSEDSMMGASSTGLVKLVGQSSQ